MNLRHLSFYGALVSATVILSGCSGSGISGPTGPGVRVINGLTTVSEAYIICGTIIVGSPIPYATITGTPAHPYSIIPTGNQTLNLESVSALTVPIVTSTINVQTTQDLDEIAYNPSKPEFLTLYDNIQIPTTAELRLVNASTVTGSVDIILTPLNISIPLTTASPPLPTVTLAPGAVWPTQTPQTGVYTSLATSGEYNLTVYPAGKDTGTPLAAEQISLPSGASWTFVVLDPPSGQTAPAVLQVQDNTLYDTSP